MRSLFPNDTFTGFGPTVLFPAGFDSVRGITRGRRALILRKGVRKFAPRLPGVYGMLDRAGQLIYVGKAKCIRSRLMSYFRVNSRDAKAGKIINRTRILLWESSPHEFIALIRELELIRRFRPRFNVQGIPGRQRYCYIALGRAPAPYAYVVRDPTGSEQHLYGPLKGMGWAKESVRRLNDWFGLRDCSQRQVMRFAEQGELFPVERAAGCLRYEIGTCLGPCASFCTQSAYSAKVVQARHFLEGTDLGPLATLEQEMLTASGAMQFERATILRDKLQDLRTLADRLGWLREARNQHTFIYPLQGADDRVAWYLIDRGRVLASVYAPQTEEERTAVSTLIRSQLAGKSAVLLPKGQVDSVLLVAAWFRKHTAERESLLTKEQALRRCR